MHAVVRIVHTPCMYSACFGMCGRFYVCLIVFVVVRVMHAVVRIVHTPCMYSVCFGMCGRLYVCLNVVVVVFVRVKHGVVRIVHTPCMYSACYGMCGTFFVCLIVFAVVSLCVSCLRWFVLYIRICIVLALVCAAGCMFVKLYLWLYLCACHACGGSYCTYALYV